MRRKATMSLNRETLLRLEAGFLRTVAGGVSGFQTCQTEMTCGSPCTNGCTVPCTHTCLTECTICTA